MSALAWTAAYLAVVLPLASVLGRLLARRAADYPTVDETGSQIAVTAREPHPAPVTPPLDPEAPCSCGKPVGDSGLEFWCSPKCVAEFQRTAFGREARPSGLGGLLDPDQVQRLRDELSARRDGVG